MPYFPQANNANHNSPANGSELLHNAKEIIHDRLYFTSVPFHPPQFPDLHFFSIDNVLIYCNFYSDFGPNNLAQVFRFCQILQDKFQNPAISSKKIILYSGLEPDKRANAAFLITAYMMLVQKKSPDEAYEPFLGINPAFVSYRDAGYGPATYHITVLDAVKGLYKALTLGLLDMENFDVEDYEFYEKVENGDLNWITNKFVALANPKEDYPYNFRPPVSSNPRFYSVYRIPELIRWFKERKVKTIIRLNNKLYERNRFIEAGIEHIDLYFPDGTTPPESILMKFLEICETREGPIAIHCKAGLGRTGTLISAYLMKHYKMTACEVISFLRVVRPGSVVGPQQNYLQSMQTKIWKLYTPSILPPEISCISQPSYYTSTRFGIPFGPFFNFAHKSRPSTAASKGTEFRKVNTVDNDRMDVDQIVQKEIANRIIPTAVTADFDQTIVAPFSKSVDDSLATNMSQMMIPIQPRKNLVTNSSTNNSNSLRSNLSEFKTPVNSRPATSNPQSHSPSRFVSELYTTNRYNLRSAGPSKAEKTDLKILGLSVSSDNSNQGKNAYNTPNK